MGHWIPTLTTTLFIVLAFVAWIAIIRKAGYSGWWILIAFVPVVNITMLMIFAFSDWPAKRELRFQAIPNIPPDPKDGQGFLNDALKFELKGNPEEAIRRYRKIADAFSGDTVSNDAKLSIEQLEKKTGQQITERDQ